MKKKILLLIVVLQIGFAKVTTAQNVGVTYSSTAFVPLSTLDVQGSVGLTITGGVATTSSTSTTYTTVAPSTSTVLYNNSATPTSITLADPTTCTNRVYIITNVSANAWKIVANAATNAGSYNNLSNVSTTSIPAYTGIIIISDGTNWRQIR